MRCKEGDLARVTGGSDAGNGNNIGKMVVVGARYDRHPLPLPSWQVYSMSAPLRCLDLSGERVERMRGVCPDAWLTPIPRPREESATPVFEFAE